MQTCVGLNGAPRRRVAVQPPVHAAVRLWDCLGRAFAPISRRFGCVLKCVARGSEEQHTVATDTVQVTEGNAVCAATPRPHRVVSVGCDSCSAHTHTLIAPPNSRSLHLTACGFNPSVTVVCARFGSICVCCFCVLCLCLFLFSLWLRLWLRGVQA